MKRDAEAGLGVLSLRIDLPQGRIGPGKIGLLEAIDREGSISAAGARAGDELQARLGPGGRAEPAARHAGGAGQPGRLSRRRARC